jgi:protein-tyrosine phosphatase
MAGAQALSHAVGLIRELRATHGEPDKAVVLVHCTHGLNRTGYFVVHALVALTQISLQQARAWT